MGKHNVELGRAGETAAVEKYLEHGYQVVANNWRCERGEIDLIVSRHDVLVFVEVKTRSSNRFGSAAEAVTCRKQQQVRMLAGIFLRTCWDRAPREIRFDVVAAYPNADGFSVEVLPDAF